MDINILSGTSCFFSNFSSNDFNNGFFTGAVAFAVISLGTILIGRFLKRNNKKTQNTDSKALAENNLKLAELTKALADEKEKSHNSFEDGALYSLVLLQREGRFVDFIKEDIKNYEDAQIGAAVRQIHSGCTKVINENFNLKALYDTKKEGEQVIVSENFNAEEIRLSGNVPSKGPYKGTLRHKGWVSQEITLPKKIGKTCSLVVCPAEVEIG